MTSQTPPSKAAETKANRPWLLTLLAHRGVQISLLVWVLAYVAVLLLADGTLPFDRPVFEKVPFAIQLTSPTIIMFEIFVLIAVTIGMTRKRAIPDMAARAPEKSLALREVLGLLGYAALAQLSGWLLGPALGFNPFSFHLAGTLVGGHEEVHVAEALTWMSYNFVVYAVVPYLYFRRRYTPTQMNLTSTSWGQDLILALVITLIESAWELAGLSHAILSLTPTQLALGVPLAFLVYALGTVLPTMVLIYSILIPRYLKLSGSVITTVLLGGATYACMHSVEGWSNFTSPANTLLSLIFVMFTYFGPGMIKTVLTLRTGSAWVHALGYHAFAPHVIIDAPHIVEIFGIK